MNTQQIQQVLEKLTGRLKCHFLGVFAADHIPTNPTRTPACLVANVDEHDKPGFHWIAIYFTDPNTVEYFDPFGVQFYYDKFAHHFAPLTLNVVSTHSIQDIDSAVCGQHCIYYLYLRSLGHSPSRILSHYLANPKFNDRMVKLFVKRYFRPPYPKPKLSIINNQTSKTQRSCLALH